MWSYIVKDLCASMIYSSRYLDHSVYLGYIADIYYSVYLDYTLFL